MRDAKYSYEDEAVVTQWLEDVTNERRGTNDFGKWLRDGRVLCK
jgi:hypothetical protein